MSEQGDEERQHQASPAQIQRAVAAGQVYRSHALAVAIQACIQLGSCLLLFSGIASGLLLWTDHYWSRTVLQWQQLDSAPAQFLIWARFLGGPLLLSLAVVWISQWLSWLVQMGWQFGKRPLLHWQQWSPQNSLGSAWSAEKWSSQAIGCVQFALSLAVSIAWGIGDWESLLALYQCPPNLWGETLSWSVARQLSPVLAIIGLGAGIDWWFQRHWYYRRLEMTDQQLRDEQRADGGPSATRNRQRHRGSSGGSALPLIATSSPQVSSIDQIRS
jgi:flagellar biosynthesis protein FlhB